MSEGGRRWDLAWSGPPRAIDRIGHPGVVCRPRCIGIQSPLVKLRSGEIMMKRASGVVAG